MDKPLTILLTNNTLATPAGSELYVRDVALSLQKRGHTPIAYSTLLGEVAEGLRASGVQVVHDLKALVCVPDIIHGQHNLETMTALLHLPSTPAIFVCHGAAPWQEVPPVFPRILRYVAVDHACLDRLYEYQVPPARIQVLRNFVDLQRFTPRGPLPPRPQRALIFSNYATEENYIPHVRAACQRAGITLDIMGLASGTAHFRPETVLASYDLVFAKARAALEALATGAAVITCDASGCGSMVTTKNWAVLRENNFGIRTLDRLMTADVLFHEIQQYDPEDAQEVSRYIRASADMEQVIDQLLELYRLTLEEHARTGVDRQAEGKAAAAYLRWLAPRLQGHVVPPPQVDLPELLGLYRSLTGMLHTTLAQLPTQHALDTALAAVRMQIEAFQRTVADEQRLLQVRLTETCTTDAALHALRAQVETLQHTLEERAHAGQGVLQSLIRRMTSRGRQLRTWLSRR